nr:hypothetical protein [Tanacetum cinerariifolium]
MRRKRVPELSAPEKLQYEADVKATNIILQGVPADIYALVSHHHVAKDFWERIELLMQGTSLTKQERECKLYDAFDKFTYIKGETMSQYYHRFTQLINDMHIYHMRNGPFVWPMIEQNTKMRRKRVPELSAPEKLQYEADVKATNIILQGVPADIYALVSHHHVAKDFWERIELLMQGTSLTKQERECKLYDAFDKFTYIKGETMSQYYHRFTQLINDMHIYQMRLQQFQVNTKFLNILPLEWSKFMTDVKLVKDLHVINFDRLLLILNIMKHMQMKFVF